MPAFALTLQGTFYDPITQGYTLPDLSDHDLRLYNKIPHRVLYDVHVTEILQFCLFIVPEIWTHYKRVEEDQLSKPLLMFLTAINLQCASRCYIIFISLTVICLTEKDTSKKHVNMCNIKLGCS